MCRTRLTVVLAATVACATYSAHLSTATALHTAHANVAVGAKSVLSYRLIGRTTLDAPVPLPNQTDVQNVLVLGSTGLVGRSLTRLLQQYGYHVLESRHRYDIDLRQPGSMDAAFNGMRIDFAFFLACEVGGSKYLHSSLGSRKIDVYNRLMYANVFPFLHRRRIPYLFSSSMHSAFNTPYGNVKRIGELTTLRGTGKVVKFWNVFGYERAGPRSHVLADWLQSCAKTGSAYALTNGWERRQFVHTDDLARALVDMMASFQRLPPIVDATSGRWLTMKHVAHTVIEATAGQCRIWFGDQKAAVAQEVSPTNLWHVASDLSGRVADMWQSYKGAQAKAARDEPYLSIIVLGSPSQSATQWHELAVESNVRANIVFAALPKDMNSVRSCIAHGDAVAASQLTACLSDSSLLHDVQKVTGQYVLLVHASTNAPPSVLTWLARENMDTNPLLLAPKVEHRVDGVDPTCAHDCTTYNFSKTGARRYSGNIGSQSACNVDNFLCFSVWHRPTVLDAAKHNATELVYASSLLLNDTQLHVKRVEDCVCVT